VSQDKIGEADGMNLEVDSKDEVMKQDEGCIPQTKTRRFKKRLPYWNDNYCKNAIYARNRARNKMNKNRTSENVANYHKLKGIAQKTIKNAAQDHWRAFCGTLNRTSKLSTVWNMAKRMNGVTVSRKLPNLEFENGIIDSDKDKANLFVTNFAKVSRDENYSPSFKIHRKQTATYVEDNLRGPTNEMYEGSEALNDCFCYHEVKRAIRDSKRNSSPGEDKITYSMLQHLPKNGIKSLLSLYNEVWKKGTMPQAWRHSIIIPVLKAGKEKQKVSSYRPISLTNL